LSVRIKEYKEVSLAQRKVTLTPWNIEDTQSSSSWLWPRITDQLPLFLRTMMFLDIEIQGSILIPSTNWCEDLQKAIILRLMGSSITRKSSNEHEFFVAITSLNKIGEGRIWDLTGDVLFPMAFKCAMLIVVRKDPRPYWCIMPNNVLMCIENRENLPHPWTEVLTSQVVANRTNWSSHVYLNGRDKDTETSTIDTAKICKKKKLEG